MASWDPGGLDGGASGVRDSTLIPSHVRWAGVLLIAGWVIFWVGASAWFLGRPPLLERLELIASHRAAWYWINGSFLVSVTLTVLGFGAFTSVLRGAGDRLLSELGLLAYVFGALLWIISLAFRLTLEVWAAQEAGKSGVIPVGFEAWRQWAGVLFAIHMVLAYLSVAAYGGALLGTGLLARWLGWTAIVFGLAGVLGFGLQFRFFQRPLMIPLVPGVIGIFLLLRRRTPARTRSRGAPDLRPES